MKRIASVLAILGAAAAASANEVPGALATALDALSKPMYRFNDVLKTPVVGVPIANHDNNQHAANENIRIQNLWDGIELMAGLLTM